MEKTFVVLVADLKKKTDGDLIRWLLSPKTHPLFRAEACSLLAERHCEAAVPALAETLGADPNGWVRSRAARALGRLGADGEARTKRALVAALSDSHILVQIEVATSLFTVMGEDASTHLVDLLERSARADTLPDGSWQGSGSLVRELIAEMMSECLWLFDLSLLRRRDELLVEVMRHDPSDTTRKAAARAMTSWVFGVHPLLGVLLDRSERKSVREEAAFALKDIGGRGADMIQGAIDEVMHRMEDEEGPPDEVLAQLVDVEGRYYWKRRNPVRPLRKRRYTYPE